MTVTSRPTLCSRARRFRVWAAAAALLLAMPANPLRGPAWAQDTPATPVTIDLGAAGKVDAVVIGANPGDQSDVVAAGDLNGDGLADMVIGTHLSPGPMNLRLHSGAVYAVFGQPILAGGTVLDLALGADLTIYGGFNEDRLGVSVSVGDVNNDGIDDVVMGAPGSDGPGAARSFCGSIHVFFGSRGLRPGSIRDVAGQFGAPPDLTIYGVKALDGLGAATSIADFNGDGLNDLAVSAPNTVGLQPGAFAAGSAYVLFGSPVEQSDPFRDLSAPAPAAPDIVIAGPEPQSTFGLRLANGDFNGDGIADLFASAPVADGPNRGRPNAGQAYVFLGGVTMLARPVRDLSRSGSADVLIYGGDPNDALGLGEVAAGDLNRDGFDDLAVAAPRADGPDNGRVDAGEIYLFFGGPQFQGEVIRDVNGQAGTVPDVSIFGGDRGDVAGMALTAGQFNADDVSDLAIGAPLASGPDNMRLQAGEFYVVYGSPGLVSGSIIDIAGTAGPKPDVIVYGPVSGDQLSQHLALGDVNGDGRVDILSMGPFGGLGSLRPSAGTMYIVLGPLG